tara:strand:- start:246 stop:479 length:234 start_codon:yes stop_codon:yes gene_type:complete
MPGMSTDGMLVVDADDTGLSIVRKDTIQDHWAPEDALPDLSDPLTVQALLLLERGEGVGPFAETEAEALIAALEAAP